MTKSVVSREAIADELENAIVSGALTAGERLPSERQLAERFGVSRPMIREAIRALAERNLVDIRPGRGTFVRGASSTAAAGRMSALYQTSHATPRHLVEARVMLECTSAALAAERAAPEDVAAMQQAADGCERGATVLEQARYDLAFHMAIARAAANPVIEVMFGSIAGLTQELMLRSLTDRAVTAASLPYHHAVLEAIRCHRPEDARRAMAEHLDVAQRYYGSDFDATIESVTRREMARLFAPGVTLEDLLAHAGSPAGEGA